MLYLSQFRRSSRSSGWHTTFAFRGSRLPTLSQTTDVMTEVYFILYFHHSVRLLTQRKRLPYLKVSLRFRELILETWSSIPPTVHSQQFCWSVKPNDER